MEFGDTSAWGCLEQVKCTGTGILRRLNLAINGVLGPDIKIAIILVRIERKMTNVGSAAGRGCKVYIVDQCSCLCQPQGFGDGHPTSWTSGSICDDDSGNGIDKREERSVKAHICRRIHPNSESMIASAMQHRTLSLLADPDNTYDGTIS